MIDKALIIGLCGRAQHGKSTLAAQLTDFLGGPGYVQRTSFAEPLKDMLATFGLQPEHLYGSQKMEKLAILGGQTPRWAMQSLGTDWGRKMIYRDIWLDAWVRKVLAKPQSIVIVDDVRFASEIEFLQDHGALLIEVYRPALMPHTLWGWARYWLRSRFAHASERVNFAEHEVSRVLNDMTPEALLVSVISRWPELLDYRPLAKNLRGVRLAKPARSEVPPDDDWTDAPFSQNFGDH